MIKALTAANRSERDTFRIPRSVQQSIPIRRVCSDGIWLVGRKHSRTWRFADINYAAASEEDQRGIFTSYGGVLNSLPTDAAAKITIINRRLNPVDFQRTILMKERGDGLDQYRRESNRILTQRAAESNNLVQEKYITLSIPQRKIEEARAYFRRVDLNLSKSFGRLDSGARPVSNHDRLRILHDFFRPGEEPYFTFDQTAAIRRGLDFRDLICPDGLRFRAGYFEMGEKFGRVLFLKVNYFLGGYSRVFGWDPRWGTLQKVWAEGSPSTGTYRPYGLDCCGFVDWVFYNASHGEYAVGYGEGVQAQHGYCAPVSWDEAQPGDLVFYPEDSHVGIVGGWDESGNVQIIHCASGHNNVVITGKAGFATVGKPGDYGE